MARGNDAIEAQAELQKKLGVELNAEALIRANKAQWPASLRAANAKRLDEEATEALDLKAVQDTLTERGLGTLLKGGCAVRGGVVVAVYVDSTGRSHKVDLPRPQARPSAAPAEAPKAKAPSAKQPPKD